MRKIINKNKFHLISEKTILLFIIVLAGLLPKPVFAQSLLEKQISDSLTSIANKYTFVEKISVDNIYINNKEKKIIIKANEKFGYMPFREENVKHIYRVLKQIFSPSYKNYKIVCMVDGQTIEELIPNFYRTKRKRDETRIFDPKKPKYSLVKNLSKPYNVTNGLERKNIALWASHGLYYEQSISRWEWQRARVMQTVEDLFTLSIVYPYLIPMLENAGATVLTPRERDMQSNEVIVDNNNKDSLSYREFNSQEVWTESDDFGFANFKSFYLQGENPFNMGSYRQIHSVEKENKASFVEYIPDFPKAGKYGIYVSYKTLPQSTENAHYTVYHKGGKTKFSVNQTMGGGTWIYLGQFNFDKGRNENGKVVLSNFTGEKEEIVTADAVKFGGGMGNIARSPDQIGILENHKSSEIKNSALKKEKVLSWETEPETSGYPRFAEGARYWLQWAGFPDSIYSPNRGANDYIDDFQSRAKWVNFLTAGSSLHPKGKGLKIPLDLSLALHTDAGTTKNDSVIGTLGIFTVGKSNGKSYNNKVSRWASRDLTDIIQTQIVEDIRMSFNDSWIRRGLWNKSYYEARVPEVPTMLLELLSHQNYADMKLGLDPRFQFLVSRSIYKGILKYLSALNDEEDYMVQPLPIRQFSCIFVDKNKVKLRWKTRMDSLEPSAVAEHFVVYTRIDDGDFDNGVLVSDTEYLKVLEQGKIYSFKVTSVNRGGESFPSEILSVCSHPHEKGNVLIINGFERVAPPAGFVIDTTYAGFLNDMDAGVPYLYGYNFTGKQYEFRRDRKWVDDDAPGFGASHANYETQILAGNSFDYPFLHGKAICAAGYSFVSCSVEAVMNDDINLNDFQTVDLILGKQKQTDVGVRENISLFKTFPLALQQKINLFCHQQGGNLLVTGASIASDMFDRNDALPDDIRFLENTLKIKYRVHQAAITGNVKFVSSPFKQFVRHQFSYYSEPNQYSYFVESPDAIEPAARDAYTFCRYAENNLSAGVIYSGKYKICALGFPFETIVSDAEREAFMKSVLDFFAKP